MSRTVIDSKIVIPTGDCLPGRKASGVEGPAFLRRAPA